MHYCMYFNFFVVRDTEIDSAKMYISNFDCIYSQTEKRKQKQKPPGGPHLKTAKQQPLMIIKAVN